jgi:hypothetical protein
VACIAVLFFNRSNTINVISNKSEERPMNDIPCLSKVAYEEKSSFFIPPYVHINFVVPLPGCGHSVIDCVWGAHRPQFIAPMM